MSALKAGDTFHDAPPLGSDRGSLEAEAPALLPIIDSQPGIHIYARSHEKFTALSRTKWETTDMTPLAIARPISEVEISAVVVVCTQANIPIAIRSGGNDVSERSRVDGGVVIDMRSMDSMILSMDRQSIRIGGGVNSGNLLKFLDENALDTPCGWGHEIGYASWACGGGYGLECGTRGLGVDQIIAGRVVTASGDVLEAQEGHGADDALWALRGGGAGVIGVVSELTVKVYPRPKALAGYIWFPYAEAEKVFGNMQKLYQDDFPEKFAGEVFLINPLDNGGIINHFFWWQLEEDGSDLEKAKDYHRRILECGTVVYDTVRDKEDHWSETTPFQFLYSNETHSTDNRMVNHNKSCVVPSFSAELGAIFARHPIPNTISAVVLHNCHGAGARRDVSAAFGNRNPHLLVGLSVQCSWEDDEMKKKMITWPTEVYEEIQSAGLATEWKYCNFNPQEQGDGKMYLGEGGVKRMREVKKRLDPDNLFSSSSPDLGDR
ncbi:hypothetical protein JX265_002060 [Neoarthrinium moseri]|uniref:FAD-binding PCMH-type domain-containing protein n=1 Tax=Neoarthrinium moseri TaxID=1658444 RepID=A0A9Q0AR95_9PEZI|nr:hypothetical protein JX265_002060 [Neoarthrinium moseri]